MGPIDVARKLVGFGQKEDACKAYELVLAGNGEPLADEKMEAAMYVLQFEGDYKLAYKGFLELNRAGEYVEDTRTIMTEAFYLPNERLLRSHYENNVRQLKKYPYLFRQDFVPFEELPVKFYPFDENTYVPYDVERDSFGDVTDYNDPVITRYFFKDLENPILAKDVYSQYELEYLNDCVRPSEYVGRENHIYLHYTDWAEFCAYLQVLNFRKLLIDQKFVFLIGDEIQQYPIDFNERFGIDYSVFPAKPVGLREINRLIWHAQLSYHNGGDFFNEIMDGHPNIISSSSMMNDTVEEALEDMRATLNDARSMKEVVEVFTYDAWENIPIIQELYLMRDRTDKDFLVALFCCNKHFVRRLDPGARIAPVIFYQPHFSYIHAELQARNRKNVILSTEQYEKISQSPVFRNFKYIKTFAPMRRITTSYGGSVRFMDGSSGKTDDGTYLYVSNEVVERVLFRGYLIDDRERILRDSVLVRFEDAKLNPKATFTALSAFLDIPYTDSMTSCTEFGQPVEIVPGEGGGFNLTAVYKKYDDYANDAERCYLEYFLQDAYRFYGYDFHYYDGRPMDEEQINELVRHFDMIKFFIRKSMKPFFEDKLAEIREKAAAQGEVKEYDKTVEEEAQEYLDNYMLDQEDRAKAAASVFMRNPQLVAKDGWPLKFMPKLELDPALLEQPLYH